MCGSPPLQLKVNNNNISASLGWVLDKHRSSLPCCLKMSGRSEEEQGSVRACREADGWSGGCVPSGWKFWKRKCSQRGYFTFAENSSSCPFQALPCGLSQQKIANYLVFSRELWIISFFNISTNVLYRTLSEIYWQLLSSVKTQNFKRKEIRIETTKTLDAIRSNYIWD